MPKLTRTTTQYLSTRRDGTITHKLVLWRGKLVALKLKPEKKKPGPRVIKLQNRKDLRRNHEDR